ncbi:holo-[acyl-carrier-protein] synthase NDAI_0E02350 [Naumovozyma dairenensis CBS 421]|uniref:4'-phosphopantetheinyl transferase domain-containing protein n=1 Tax=Naumovozyma dairenensis (strain ATCC 10597 / BCRC 20456 / CBS 421 / NBRC 0211 / NRRL Y-12639) TaxID=1071378 RepID=G0WBD2_NAUDC|nr:hypothetical protein NDAI_0E02350 [Naumovozyma dairenensis CBS 421]CCD25052.1 hypothetical protein NDAI_0E02350 [Naumovozyma dairenensis CBS 421]
MQKLQMLRQARNLLGIGTDIVYLPRFQRLLMKYTNDDDVYAIKSSSALDRINDKFMHPIERATFRSLANESLSKRAKYLAGVWATKEATLKALHCYIPSEHIPPAQVIYTKLLYKTNNTSTGSPQLQFDKNFSTTTPLYSQFFRDYINGKISTLLSISHDEQYLVSFVCLTSK